MKFASFLLGLGLVALMGCRSQTPVEESSKVDQPLVEDKYKLTQDRKAFEEIRSQVPPEKRQENDEIGFLMQWMGEVKKTPSEIREKFNATVTKKRGVFQKDMEKKRETFVKKERKDREDFTREMEKTRNDFGRRKAKADERKEFFEGIDQKRRDFYADQREKRDEFEGDMRDQRRNFDDYIREKTNEFNQEHRAYVKRYDDWQKEQREKKKKQEEERKNQGKSLEGEFSEIRKKPPQTLGTEESPAE